MITPPYEEAPTVAATTSGPKGQAIRSGNCRSFGEDCKSSCSPEQKLLATAKAALGLRGHAVHELANGGYLVSRWNMTRHCWDLRELMTFARQVGAIA